MDIITGHLVCKEKIKVWHPKNNESGFSISMASGGWLVGSFNSVESAIKGAEHNLKLTPSFFEMQKRVNHVNQENRLIVLEDFDGL